MSDSIYQEKLDRAMFELHSKGIHRKQSRPLLFKFLRMLGFKIRLPHYSEPISVLIYSGVYFTALIAALLWLVQSRSSGISAPYIAALAISFAALFVVVMMSLNIYNRKKYDLTPWEEI